MEDSDSKSVRDAILKTLQDLGNDNFREFCDKLTDTEEDERMCIKASEVESKNRTHITKLLISRCEESGAVERTVRTLRAIGCNNEASKLESMFKPQTKAESKPAPKPLSDRANKEPKAPKKVKKKTSKTRKSPKSGKTLLQFGQYKDKGRSFKWVLENDMQYAVYVVATHQMDREAGNTSQTEHMKHKDALAEYVSHFPAAVEEVHFYKEGRANVGFGQYKNKTRRDLYNSKDEKEKSYINWLRSMENAGKGALMEAMIKYILHRDKTASVSTCSKAGAQKRSCTLGRAPPEPSFQPAVKKPRL